MKNTIILLLGLALCLMGSSLYANTIYNVIDLGTLGGTESKATSINYNGQIVGIAKNSSGKYRATLFDSTGSGANIDLGTLGGNGSHAKSINDNGQIVGSAQFSLDSFEYHATMFDPTGNGFNVDLGTLGGNNSSANSINNQGQIVGSSRPGPEPFIGHATLFDPTGNGANIDLGTLGGNSSAAYSINNQGQIVGFANLIDDSHATMFDPTGNGANIDLGPGPHRGWSGANSINDNGQIVGYVQADENSEAAKFPGASRLGFLGGFDSMAYSINSSGQIVGRSMTDYPYRGHAALFVSGPNIDLNTLISPDSGWELNVAYDINDKGWIVGYGINPEGNEHGFLLIPKPFLAVQDPNGGEELIAGSQYPITWDSSDDITNVKLEYSSNSGSSWWKIDPNTNNDGSYSWPVPWISSNQCLVRVSDTNDPNISDTSDDVFTIGPFPPQYPTLKDILGEPVPPVLESGCDYAELLVPDANSVVTLLLEATGDKDENIFGIYNPEDPSEKLELFAGLDSPPDSVIIQFDLMAGIAKNLSTGDTANIGTGFGFYLLNPTGSHDTTFYTDASLNPDGAEHGLLYDTSAYKGTIIGNPDTVIAFEDAYGLGDRDYDDMVVGITNITPVASYCTKEIKGDFNGDCIVDGFDFAILAAHWQECSNVASFQGLGDLLDGTFSSIAYDVSANGKVVVGMGNSESGDEGFCWSEIGGMVGLGDLPGGDYFSYAKSASADGSVVVGRSVSNLGTEAYRWTEAEGMIGLGDLPGGKFHSHGKGVSADGSVVAGNSVSGSGAEAFRWTVSDGMVGLGDLPGGNLYSNAWSVSADGLTVVGNSGSAYSNHEAFRWTNADGMVPLGDLPGGSFESRAAGVSDDGSVIVGYSNSISGDEAFRWTESEGMQGLGDLPGGDFYSIAWDVSADGKIVVGESVSESSLKEAFIWDMDSGMVNLNDLLINEYDIDLTGWILHESKGISADGLTIVGKGTNPYGNYEAWIATIPGSDCPYEIPGDSNGDCCVNILDLAILCSHWLNCNLMPESACWK